MAEDRKYFIFNKPMDYRRGTVDRMNAADGILRLTGAEPGWFFSRVLDQCHLVKLIGSLRGKPLTKIYKL